MTKKLVILISALTTLAFAALTTTRLMMDYTENGFYFDGEVTYRTNAIPVYALITLVLLVLTIALRLYWRKSPTG